MATFGPEEKDPSFGLVSISRVQGMRRLFDSPFEHQHFITLSIKRAYRSRTDLHSDYIGEREELIEVSMSEVQFATMVTSLNMGAGTSCTISHFNGKVVPEPKADQTKQTFAHEAREHFTDLAKIASELEKLTAMPAKDVKAPQRERMAFLALKIHQDLAGNMDFFHEQFQKTMDKAVSAAKGEIQAHVASIIQKTGLKALGERDLPRLDVEKPESVSRE